MSHWCSLYSYLSKLYAQQVADNMKNDIQVGVKIRGKGEARYDLKRCNCERKSVENIEQMMGVKPDVT